MSNMLDEIMGSPMAELDKLCEIARSLDEKYGVSEKFAEYEKSLNEEIEDLENETHCYSY